MKKILATSATVLSLAACAQANLPNQSEEPIVGIANPASEFCIKQGGKLEIRKDKDGNEYGVCHLPNGLEMEEWEYFRATSK